MGLLVANGHDVVVESGAGTGSNYSDRQYSESGARIVYSPKEVFETNIILKIDPPTLEEIALIKPYTTVISALQMNQLNSDYLVAINKKRINAIAFELIEDKGGSKPVVRSISEIASICIISIANRRI